MHPSHRVESPTKVHIVPSASGDPTHVPFWHSSVVVHALPSLQVVPFVAVGFEQPVVGLHVPAT
jgi:hypothetical protein